MEVPDHGMEHQIGKIGKWETDGLSIFFWNIKQGVHSKVLMTGKTRFTARFRPLGHDHGECGPQASENVDISSSRLAMFEKGWMALMSLLRSRETKNLTWLHPTAKISASPGCKVISRRVLAFAKHCISLEGTRELPAYIIDARSRWID